MLILGEIALNRRICYEKEKQYRLGLDIYSVGRSVLTQELWNLGCLPEHI